MLLTEDNSLTNSDELQAGTAQLDGILCSTGVIILPMPPHHAFAIDPLLELRWDSNIPGSMHHKEKKVTGTISLQRGLGKLRSEENYGGIFTAFIPHNTSFSRGWHKAALFPRTLGDYNTKRKGPEVTCATYWRQG